jgi:HlyD family secretion protein
MSMDRQIKKSKWPFRKIAIYAVVLAGLVAIISMIVRDAGTSRLNVESERLLTDTINRGVFKEYITLFGSVEPIKTVYIDAIESGRIEQIYVEDGAMVDAGEEIMRLSNLELQLNVLNQEAQIVNQINTIRNQSILMEQQSLNLREQALSVAFQIDLFEKRTNRNQKLYADAVISQVDFEETEDEYEHLLRRREMLAATIAKDSLYHALQQGQMETTLDLMRRNLGIAKSSLGNLIIRAPINGQLSSMDSEIGELINRGDRIAQIDELEDFKIRASIDEFYLRRVFPQQEAAFTMDGRTYELQIKKIYPTVTNGAFEVDMVFTSDRPDNITRGQTISLKLSLSDETEALLLAKGGFYQATGGNWVYVIDPATGNARKRDIRIGRQNPNYYEVQQGLEEGDIVIISNYENFGDKDELVLK